MSIHERETREVLSIGLRSRFRFFNKDSDGRAFHTVNVQRRYKDGDQWKSANSFTATELANAVAVMQRAIVYLLDQQPANNIE